MTAPVRIGMIDTGVNSAHPHVGNIAGGVTIGTNRETPCYEDGLGHGTAIAALLQQQAPEAQLIAVKVFDRTLATNRDTVIRAIDWCLQNEIDIINLSLGTANSAHRSEFESESAALSSAKIIFSASPYPREIPGVPHDRNLHGVSFAVAHVTAALARIWPAARPSQDWESTLANALPDCQSVEA